MPTRRLFVTRAAAAGIGLAVLGAVVAPPASAAVPGIRDGKGFKLLRATFYNHPASTLPNADGATGNNLHGFTYIEDQVRGAGWVRNGVANGRADWIATGWKEIDYGLRRMQPDGSFACPDNFHSTSYFLESVARACLMRPAGASAWRRERLRRGILWLTDADVFAAGVRGNKAYAHRRYLVAAAILQASRVLGDPSFTAGARDLVDDALAMQQEDGTNPERGGFDVGYQAVGALMAVRCLPALDPARQAAVKAMLARAMNREARQVGRDGVVDASGSTRTGVEKDRVGNIKSIPYDTIAEAFALAYDQTYVKAHYAAAAAVVAARGW